jgi:hypothetical protein
VSASSEERNAASVCVGGGGEKKGKRCAIFLVCFTSNKWSARDIVEYKKKSRRKKRKSDLIPVSAYKRFQKKKRKTAKKGR